MTAMEVKTFATTDSGNTQILIEINKKGIQSSDVPIIIKNVKDELQRMVALAKTSQEKDDETWENDRVKDSPHHSDGPEEPCMDSVTGILSDILPEVASESTAQEPNETEPDKTDLVKIEDVDDLTSRQFEIETEKYYAVDYVKRFYIGRVLQKIDENKFKMKFLSKANSLEYVWPKREDIDIVHRSCLFFGPIHLVGNGPFTIPNAENITKKFKDVCKSCS